MEVGVSFHEHIHICVGGQIGLPFEHLEYPYSQLFFCTQCVCVCAKKLGSRDWERGYI